MLYNPLPSLPIAIGKLSGLPPEGKEHQLFPPGGNGKGGEILTINDN